MFTKTAVGPGYWYKHKHPWIAGFVAVVKVIGFINNTVREKWKCETCQHEFSAGIELTEAEQQRLAQEQAEREYQRQAAERQRQEVERQRLEAERRRRAAERPKEAAALGWATFFGFVIAGVFLGFAGGNGWFFKDAIDQAEKEATERGDEVNKPIGMFIGRFLMGRLSRHPVQIAVQDAAIPLFPLALIVCMAYFGTGWNTKAFIGSLVFCLICCLVRVLVWLSTWPITVFVDHLTSPAQGAILIGLSFGLWGIPIGLLVYLVYKSGSG
jgi:hypothetical protein